MEKKVKIQTKAVHAGDRKKTGRHIPITTPIHTAVSFFYEDIGNAGPRVRTRGSRL